MKKYALYNSLACNGRGKELAMELKALYPDDEIIFQDVIELQDYAAYVKETDAPIVICGGDGTINKFANQTKGVRDGKEIYYFACGSGNDFMRDVAEEGEKIVRIDEYLKGLPTVIVKGTEYEFVNGVGYGIDGDNAPFECCRRHSADFAFLNVCSVVTHPLLRSPRWCCILRHAVRALCLQGSGPNIVRNAPCIQ